LFGLVGAMVNFLHSIQEGMRNDSFFWFCALSGSGLFILQLIVRLFGGSAFDDLDGESGEIDAGNLKWLSKQTLSGFLMIFGWVGLTCRKEWNFSVISTALTASVAGLFSVFILGAIFKSAKKLRSQGTIFRIDDAIGKEATVYQHIPKTGTGKITLSLNELTYEIDAISHHSEELPSFTKVQIIGKADDNTVVVISNN
jgi:hypothetical protein